MAIARNVLTSETASAPASSAARANEATSVTFGVSLGISGRVVTLRTAAVTCAVPARLHPNWMPPSLMFGHEMFSSMAATPSCVGQHTRHFRILVERRPADVDDGARAALAQQRQLLADEAMDANALQADRVQHAGGRFGDARRRVALPLLEEQPLDGDAAEHRQIDDLVVFEAIAKAAAGGDDRIGQLERTNADALDRSCQSHDDLGAIEHRVRRCMSGRNARGPSPSRSWHDTAVAAAEAAAHDPLDRHF